MAHLFILSLVLFITVNSVTIWTQDMDTSTGFSSWNESLSGTLAQRNDQYCPRYNVTGSPSPCWSVCGDGESIYRVTDVSLYSDITLTFSIDPYAMQNIDDSCDIQWSSDNLNWNVLDSSSGANHINDRTIDIPNTGWNIPNLYISVNVVSTDGGVDCCRISNFILNGTINTISTTSIYTTSSPTNDVNFFIDNDWILRQKYPFPVDLCIQTNPDIPFAGLYPEFTYYECSSSGASVTKYRWNQANIDCVNKSTADEVTTYNRFIGDSCDKYYFECNGRDDYASIDLYLSFTSRDCSSPSPLFSISIATGICYCDSSSTSLSLACSPGTASISNYSDSYCLANTSIQTDVGEIGTPSFFTEYDGTYTICAEMVECIQDSIDVLTNPPSNAPTEYISTTISISSSILTNTNGDDQGKQDQGKSDGLLVAIIVIAVLSVISICCFIFWWKRNKNKNKNNEHDLIPNQQIIPELQQVKSGSNENLNPIDQDDLEMINIEGAMPNNTSGNHITAGAPSMIMDNNDNAESEEDNGNDKDNELPLPQNENQNNDDNAGSDEDVDEGGKEEYVTVGGPEPAEGGFAIPQQTAGGPN